jgi:hypothetical protein
MQIVWSLFWNSHDVGGNDDGDNIPIATIYVTGSCKSAMLGAWEVKVNKIDRNILVYGTPIQWRKINIKQ